jgi:hypothetical protein
MGKFCEIFLAKEYANELIVKHANRLYLIEPTLPDAWGKRISLSAFPEGARKISMSLQSYKWLGLPMETDNVENSE